MAYEPAVEADPPRKLLRLLLELPVLPGVAEHAGVKARLQGVKIPVRLLHRSNALGAEGGEGCLSLPEQYGVVKRPNHVKVRAQDRNGNTFEVEGTGLTARCFCHEIDHLDGILFTDRATHMYTDEEMEELYGGDDKE